jgi:serine/threonine-protein kinase
MTLTAGTVLVNRYRVASLLGQGGFGAVYRGWDITLSRPCAIKENFDTSDEARRQFLREATVLANLTHPNLPRVNDHFVIEGQGQYLVMDFIRGDDLEKIVANRGCIDPAQAVDWIDQVLDALNYLHTRPQPVIHRDIKPANIKITPEGRAMLVDFGLVKIYDPHLRTTAGARAITAGFSPPEQYGQAVTDARTDIYALGATLYMLLTGTPPVESVLRITQDDLPAAHLLNPAVPEALSQVISKAMELRPAQRFQTAKEFQKALEAAIPVTVPLPVNESVITAGPGPSIPQVASTMHVAAPPAKPVVVPPAKVKKRNTLPWALGIGTGILVLGFIFLVLSFLIRPQKGNPVSETTPSPVTQIAGLKNADIKVCVLGNESTDIYGYNSITWEGAHTAQEKFEVSIDYLQADTSQSDPYGPVVQKAIDIDCNLIIGNSFLWADAILKISPQYPNQLFGLVDSSFEHSLSNVLDSWFEISQSGFLAGYLAASQTKTGVVATFGGMDIPMVTHYMNGFALGVEAFNKSTDAGVKVLGWDSKNLQGTITGDFSNKDKGYEVAKQYIHQGADIIFPVAGVENVGAMQLCNESEKCRIIACDMDATQLYPEYADIILASAVKNFTVFVVNATEMLVNNKFAGGTWIGNLQNNGVDLVINPKYSSQVSEELLDKMEGIRKSLISGEINPVPGAKIDHSDIKVCLLRSNQINDGSYNQAAWEGLIKAKDTLGVDIAYYPSDDVTAIDPSPVMEKAVADDCSLIFGDFYYADQITQWSEKIPDRSFVLIDSFVDNKPPNLMDTWYEISQPAFLAGYLSAGYSKTGVVGAFGGMDILPVTNYMHGFALGVDYYNQNHGSNVQVIGWDIAAKTGYFTNDFASKELGYETARLFVEGNNTDVIFPIGGVENAGVLQYCKDTGSCVVIGSDVDAVKQFPDFSSVILASAVKRFDTLILNATKLVVDGSFPGETWKGTLDIEGVEMVINPAYQSLFSIGFLSELENMKGKIARYEIKTYP